AALFKLGLVTHSNCYGFLVLGLNRDGSIGNAGDRAHYVFFLAVSKYHYRQCKQQSTYRDRPSQDFSSVILMCDVLAAGLLVSPSFKNCSSSCCSLHASGPLGFSRSISRSSSGVSRGR